MTGRRLALADQDAALDVVHSQADDHTWPPLVDYPNMDHFFVFGRAVYDPTAGRRGALDAGTASWLGLVARRLSGNPNPALAR